MISGTKPASSIIAASAAARHGCSTTTDSRAPAPTITIWPAPPAPGEVGDRGRHRLRREKGQLAHVTDSRSPRATIRAAQSHNENPRRTR
ncbi:putative lipoprotein [Mycobacterium xenopi 3993]|nr:putative lipoprotein [Mycobacterium xenopi 3993]